jgi:hypothetical protein
VVGVCRGHEVHPEGASYSCTCNQYRPNPRCICGYRKSNHADRDAPSVPGRCFLNRSCRGFRQETFDHDDERALVHRILGEWQHERSNLSARTRMGWQLSDTRDKIVCPICANTVLQLQLRTLHGYEVPEYEVPEDLQAEADFHVTQCLLGWWAGRESL